MPFAVAWMDLDIILPSEVSQTEEAKYHITLSKVKEFYSQS